MLLKLAAFLADAGGTVRRATDLGLAMLHTRLRLFSLEIKEEQLRLVQALVWAGLGLGLVFMGLILVVLAVLQAVGEEHRLLALTLSAAGMLLAGATALLLTVARLKRRPAPFAQTMAELKKDREWLSGSSSDT